MRKLQELLNIFYSLLRSQYLFVKYLIVIFLHRNMCSSFLGLDEIGGDADFQLDSSINPAGSAHMFLYS